MINKFLIGRDELINSDTGKIGLTGGQSEFTLTIDQMPYHTHLDRGHSHSINFNTNNVGDHSHGYKVHICSISFCSLYDNLFFF